MRVVVAIDSFKGSMSSLEAGEAISNGIKKAHKDAEVEIRPLADGGEGTVEALSIGMGGRLINVDVTGPAGKSVNAVYGIVDSSKTAIIEMSQAAGITLVSGDEKNPLYTTTFGVGELIKDAINKGCRHFVVGIGGSATNDCGIGMLSELGIKFIDEQGQLCRCGINDLSKIDVIDNKNINSKLTKARFSIISDVSNPLIGKNGATYIFSKQKGLDENKFAEVDKYIEKFSKVFIYQY